MTKYRKMLSKNQVFLMLLMECPQIHEYVSLLSFASKDISRLHDLI